MPKRTFDKETKWQPYANFMLLKPTVEDEVIPGSNLVLPDSARRKPSSGFVVKMGTLVEHFNIGDEVFFEQHQEYRVKLDDTQEEAVVIDASKIILFLPVETETAVMRSF